MEQAGKSQAEASQWVHEYSDMLYRYAVQRVRSADTAKDLVQDTFLSAWRNYEGYRGEASVKSWLFVILKRKLIDHYRRAAGRLTEELVTDGTDDAAFFDGSDHWTKEASPAAWRTDDESGLEKSEFYSILDGCKRKLKEIQNAVFTMKYMDDLDSEEICKVLGVSPSNYWVLLHRAKVQLRACLEMNWFSR